MKQFDLTPTDSRKSFYGKAKVIEDNAGVIAKLQSYDTIVAEYNKDLNKLTINGYYSATTARHINAFLAHFGFETMTKKQIENYKN